MTCPLDTCSQQNENSLFVLKSPLASFQLWRAPWSPSAAHMLSRKICPFFHFVDIVWLLVFYSDIYSKPFNITRREYSNFVNRTIFIYLITSFDVHCRHRWMLFEVTLKHFVYRYNCYFYVKNTNAKIIKTLCNILIFWHELVYTKFLLIFFTV